MRPDSAGGPDQGGTVRRDIAYRLLATAVAMMRPGRREGVEGEIHRDLATLARNKAVSEAAHPEDGDAGRKGG